MLKKQLDTCVVIKMLLMKELHGPPNTCNVYSVIAPPQ